MTSRVVRVVVHQCGFAGCRVGEASNTGPVQTRQARRLERFNPIGSSRGLYSTQFDLSSDEEVLVRPNSGRHVVPRMDGDLSATIPASSGALCVAGVCPASGSQNSRRVVLTSRVAEEPETPVPASHSALVDAGRAGLDVPPTFLDALEEDLATNTGATEVASSSPRVRLEIASSWRESNDRVAEVATLTPGREKAGWRLEVGLSRGGTQSVEAFDLSSREADDISNSSHESDTDSFDWVPDDNGSVVSGVHESPEPEEVVVMEEIRAIPAGFRDAFRSMDEVDLGVIFWRRGVVMKSFPQCLKGPFRNAMKVVLEEIIAGSDHHDHPKRGTGVEGVLVIAKVIAAQAVSGWEDG